MSNREKYCHAYKEWLGFKEELIYSNRFFLESNMPAKIEKLIAKCEDYIAEGEILFRAREYTLNYTQKTPDLITEKEEIENSRNMMLEQLISAANKDDIWSLHMKDPMSLSLIEEMKKTSEWGYSQKDSGMPNREKAGLNRASPKYIAYLYLANDVNTSLAETRAQIRQKFSVAQYKITKPLRIVNFLKNPKYDETTKEEEFVLYNSICQAFSAPSITDEKDYIISQYIAENIKKMKFQGIAFGSSRRKGGINYTLFNDDACEFIKSELYIVKNIEITSEKIFPPKKSV